MAGSVCVVPKTGGSACFLWDTQADRRFANAIADDVALDVGEGTAIRNCNDEFESCGVAYRAVRGGELRTTPAGWVVAGLVGAVSLGVIAALAKAALKPGVRW